MHIETNDAVNMYHSPFLVSVICRPDPYKPGDGDEQGNIHAAGDGHSVPGRPRHGDAHVAAEARLLLRVAQHVE